MATTEHKSRTPSSDGSFWSQQTVLFLIAGLLVGSYMAQLFIMSTTSRPDWMSYSKYLQEEMYNPNSKFHEDLANAEVSLIDGSHVHKYENATVAAQMYKEVRVLCLIPTHPKNLNRAKSVKRTWGKRCNKLLFMSGVNIKELDAIKLNTSEGKDLQWGKIKEAFKYVYKHHIDEYDWFFKAEDDTYAIIENLRYFLYPYSPETPIYFGARFRPMIRQGYMSGGAGYVLSREAVRRLVTEAIPNPDICKKTNAGAEDIHIGWCLQNVNVTPGDTRDSQARGRFFPFKPDKHLMAKPNDSFWYWKYIYYKTDEGLDCCSDYAITFHELKPGEILVLDFLIYHLRPYGIVNIPEELPPKLDVGETMPPPTDLPTTAAATNST